jgi:hypothetical protein
MGSRKWVTTYWSHNNRATLDGVVVHYLSVCTWVSVETCAYMWVFLSKCAYISRNMKYQGHTVDQELLRFASIVYSFLYLFVSHFPRYKSPCNL